MFRKYYKLTLIFIIFILIFSFPVKAVSNNEEVTIMANKYCNLNGVNYIKDEFTKINVGFDKVETDVNANANLITEVNNRIDNIITTPAESVSAQEIIDARNGEAVLGDRLNGIDTSISGSVIISKGDLTPIIKQNGSKVIFTGDSLSFNRHPFQAGTIGNNNAYEYQVGMLSWSFMIRDAIHRMDEYFKNITEIPIRTKNLDANIVYYPLSAPYKNAAFNGIIADLRTKRNTEEFKFQYKHNNANNKAIIYSTYSALTNCASFDVYVDNVFQKNVNTYGVGKDHQGYDTLPIEVDLLGDNQYHEIKLTNFVQTHPAPSADGLMLTFIYGIGTKYTEIHMTGKGNTTSQWLLDNIQERILDFNSDIVFIATGANDITNSITADQTYANVKAIVEAIRTNKPSTEIILLSTTRRSTQTIVETLPYADALRKVAQEKDCGFVDLVKLFVDVNTNIDKMAWSFDGVHMSILGNDILAQTVLREFFNGANYPKELVSGDEAYYRDKTKYEYPKQIHGWARLSFSSGDYVIDSQSSEKWIESVVKSGTNKIVIKFKANAVMTINSVVRSGFVYGLSAQQYFTTSTPPNLALSVQLAGWALDTITLYLRKIDGTAILETDYTNEPTAFKIMITY